MSGTRLDQRLVELGHLESREKARATIMSGLVFVNGQRADKPGMPVKEDAAIEVRGSACPYVSRGGFKLENPDDPTRGGEDFGPIHLSDEQLAQLDRLQALSDDIKASADAVRGLSGSVNGAIQTGSNSAVQAGDNSAGKAGNNSAVQTGDNSADSAGSSSRKFRLRKFWLWQFRI